MAKPILLVKINSREYTLEQVKATKEILKDQLENEYHVLFISSDKVSDIEFSVHGIAEYIL